jgi:hypothetical protein
MTQNKRSRKRKTARWYLKTYSKTMTTIVEEDKRMKATSKKRASTRKGRILGGLW